MQLLLSSYCFWSIARTIATHSTGAMWGACGMRVAKESPIIAWAPSFLQGTWDLWSFVIIHRTERAELFAFRLNTDFLYFFILSILTTLREDLYQNPGQILSYILSSALSSFSIPPSLLSSSGNCSHILGSCSCHFLCSIRWTCWHTPIVPVRMYPPRNSLLACSHWSPTQQEQILFGDF